jgi:hypothetical protein
LHTSPGGQSLAVWQLLLATQAPLEQVCPEAQSRSALHCATQRPDEQICGAGQSLL